MRWHGKQQTGTASSRGIVRARAGMHIVPLRALVLLQTHEAVKLACADGGGSSHGTQTQDAATALLQVCNL